MSLSALLLPLFTLKSRLPGKLVDHLTDKQKLIYDLSLQCAALHVQRGDCTGHYLEADMLDCFTSSLQAYSVMDSTAFEEALETIKTV